jgi:transcription antitermination factor NusG
MRMTAAAPGLVLDPLPPPAHIRSSAASDTPIAAFQQSPSLPSYFWANSLRCHASNGTEAATSSRALVPFRLNFGDDVVDPRGADAHPHRVSGRAEDRFIARTIAGIDRSGANRASGILDKIEAQRWYFPLDKLFAMAEREQELPWYALKVRTGVERRLKTTLERKGCRVFLPTWLDCRRYSDRIKPIQAPLFPGYLFCRLDISYRLPILTTPGVGSILGSGSEPLPIDELEMAAIQRLAEPGSSPVPWPYLREGDRVRVQWGPLAGIDGFVLRADGKDRLILSLHLLQRSVAVQIDRLHIRPLEGRVV